MVERGELGRSGKALRDSQVIRTDIDRSSSGPDRGRFAVRLISVMLVSAGLCMGIAAQAAGPFTPISPDLSTVEFADVLSGQKEPPRVVGGVLAILLGPFGGHRLYLGTNTKVPIIYVLTLGGGFGVLPLIDLAHIIFSKDLDRFRNNDRVLMWTGSGQ